MRSLPITVLLILAAFALGLTLGGELPRSVSAQDEQEEISWDHDGENLVLFNQTDKEVFLVRGKTDEDAGAEAPPKDASGYVAVAATGVDEILVYKLKAELICDPRQCRRCNGEYCPAPQWPPFNDEDIRTLLGPS